MSPDHTVTTQLRLPGHHSFLELALSFVTNSAELFKFSEKEVFQIRLGAEEAISNIMKHALSNNIEESFEITCLFKKTQFEIVIHEKGKPFEAEKITKYNPDAIDIDGSAEGLGMYLIQKAMDKVEYHNMGRDAKETVLIKYPKSQRIDNILTTKSKKQPKTEGGTFTIRKFQDEDAIGVSECAYAAYGYSYESYIYYPSQIIKMNHEHKLRSYVSCGSDENIAGHIALKYDNNPSIAEIGVAFVKPEVRGNHIATDMMDYALSASKSIEGLNCVFARTVTSHTISQDVLLNKDFVPTAITLALFPSDVDFKDLSGKVAQKDGALFLCLNTRRDNSVREIFLPGKHAGMIEDMFKSLGYKTVSGTTEDNSKTEHGGTLINYRIIDIFNCAEIYCSNYSDKTGSKIKITLKALCLNRVDAIYLYLNLEDELTPVIAQECEEMGFFFAGVLPFGIDGRHAIIYQYLNNLSFDFTLTKISHPLAIKLKEYVSRCYDEARTV